MNHAPIKSQRGYIALISVIIISAVLIIITFATSFGAFFARFNSLDGEFKKQSAALAEGCIDTALLQLARDPNNTATETFTIGAGVCSIVSIQLNSPASGQVAIKSQAIVHNAVTNIAVVASRANLSLVSWEELPN